MDEIRHAAHHLPHYISKRARASSDKGGKVGLALQGRPVGTVRIWRLNGAGFNLARKLQKPVAVSDIRAIKRRPQDLLEWTPTAGRGSPIRMASPALLDAWQARGA